MTYKIAGHTMGTPEYTVCEAIELFHRIGADGAEIVVQDDYRSGIPCDCDQDTLEKIKKCAADNHIEIVALTPYNSKFNSLDETERNAEIKEIGKVIDYADFLGAKYIRIYGGNLAAGDTKDYNKKRNYLIESLRVMGDMAEKKGVILVVENHFNTMAVTARQSADLIRDVNHKAVRILYDQANLTFTGNEDYEEAIAIQQQYVAHMHVKDLVFIEGRSFVSSDVSHPEESERNVVTKIVGDGIIKWPEILSLVEEKEYNGWLSLEYERRWHPADIPDASIGMKKAVEYLKNLAV